MEYWDERLSTVAAQPGAARGKRVPGEGRQVVDQVAAALILQGWLDAHRPAVQGDEW